MHCSSQNPICCYTGKTFPRQQDSADRGIHSGSLRRFSSRRGDGERLGRAEVYRRSFHVRANKELMPLKQQSFAFVVVLWLLQSLTIICSSYSTGVVQFRPFVNRCVLRLGAQRTHSTRRRDTKRRDRAVSVQQSLVQNSEIATSPCRRTMCPCCCKLRYWNSARLNGVCILLHTALQLIAALCNAGTRPVIQAAHWASTQLSGSSSLSQSVKFSMKLRWMHRHLHIPEGTHATAV
jgi:hypothetical protein